MAEGSLTGATFAAAFALYARTCYRSAAGGDSSEFLVVAALFPRAVAHPPGYPLLTGLAAAAARLARAPEEVVLAVNLLNAALAAAAAAAVQAAASELVRAADGDCGRLEPWRPLCSGLAAGLFASHPLVWRYATQVEVFALNNALLGALLLLFLRAARAECAAGLALPAAAGAFTIGLALANQHTSVLFAAPLACGVLALGALRGVARPLRALAVLAACGLAGLAPYAHAALAQRAPHPFTWPVEAHSLAGLAELVLRRDYGTLQLQATRRWEHRYAEGPQGAEEGSPAVVNVTEAPAGWGLRAGANAAHFWASAGASATSPVHAYAFLPGALLGSASCIAGLRGAPGGQVVAAVALHAALATYLAVMCGLSNFESHDGAMGGVLERFWAQPLVLLAPLQALGTARALGALAPRGPAAGLVQLSAGAAAAAAVLGAVLLLWPRLDRSEDSTVEDFYGCVLRAMPPNATLLVKGDTPTYVLRYWQAVRHARPDVLLLAAPLLSPRLQRLAGAEVRERHGVELPPGPQLRHFLEPLAAGEEAARQRPLVLLGYYGTLGPRTSPLWPLPGFELWPLPGPARLVLRDDDAQRLDALAWAKRQLKRCRCTERLRRAVAKDGGWAQLDEGSPERATAAGYWAQAEQIVVHAIQWATGRPGGEGGSAAQESGGSLEPGIC